MNFLQLQERRDLDTWDDLAVVWGALEAEAAAGSLLQEDRCIRVFERSIAAR